MISSLVLLALAGAPPPADIVARPTWVERRSPRLIRQDALNRQDDGFSDSYSRTAALAQVYENEFAGFRMRYPKGWTAHDLLDSNGTVTSVMAFLSPESDIDDAGRENINLVIEDLTSLGVSFEEYSDQAIESERELFQDYKLHANVRTLWKGLPARSIRYDATFNGRRLTFEQLWFARNGTIYVWTLASPPSTIDHYAGLFRKMVGSLSFNG